jgi:hypothetical protein
MTAGNPKTLMLVGAHHDDNEFNAGTIQKHAVPLRVPREWWVVEASCVLVCGHPRYLAIPMESRGKKLSRHSGKIMRGKWVV